jgi:hypothetical protein
MTLYERKYFVSIISSLLIALIYAVYMYQIFQSYSYTLSSNFAYWGKVILVFIGMSVASRSIIYLVFNFILKIPKIGNDPTFTEEMDKLIELKASRNSMYVFMAGFMISVALLIIYLPPYIMFIGITFSGLASEVTADASQIYYYRSGV